MSLLEICHALDPAAFARDRLGFHPDPHQASVLGSRAKRVILNCTRQWGKSPSPRPGLSSRLGVSPNPSSSAPTARQSAGLVRKCGVFPSRLGVKPRGDVGNKISLRLPNGARIIGLPGTKANDRGFSGVRLLLVDQASRVSEDLYLAKAPRPRRQRRRHWLISAPVGQRGFFYQTGSVRVPAPEARASGRNTPPATAPPWAIDGSPRKYLCEFADNQEQLFPEQLI